MGTEELAGRSMGAAGDRLSACGGGAPPAAALDRFAGLGQLRAQDPQYLRRCVLKGLCEQRPARAWSERGTLDTPVEFLFEAAHAEARRLGWLRTGERAWEAEALRRAGRN